MEQLKNAVKNELKNDILRLNGESPAPAVGSSVVLKSESPMWNTKNTIPEKVRIQMVGLMQVQLAESLELKLRIKNSHWNIKGLNFIALHELFDKLATDVEAHSDLIAERMIQLGGTTEGTLAQVLKNSQLPELPAITLSELDHLNLIAHALAAFGEGTRKIISQAEQLCDPVTMDLFTEVSRKTDKNLWFIEAHYQKENLRMSTKH